MADRAVLQVDQAKPENQNLSWHQQKRGHDSSMGRCLRFPDARLLKVFIQSIGINAANNATAATEFVHAKRLDGPATRRPA